MDRTTARIVSAATMAGLLVILVAGVAWAWSAFTEPFPDAADAPQCEQLQVAAGDTLKPAQVVVSVLNASTREGLAGFTQQQLDERGFGAGDIDNAPEDVVIGTAKIWTTDPESPAVDLVQGYLGGEIRVIDRDSGLPGVTVVVGNAFAGVVDGPRKVEAGTDATVCSPPPQES